MFGGSFNPIHFGHLLLADEISEALDLQRVLFVPAGAPPHKPATGLAPAPHRLRMTALAIHEHSRFELCDIETRRPGPSYTVDTLVALRSRGRLHLLIGSETFADLLHWREPQRVVRLARLIVVPRHGNGFDPESPASRKVLNELGLPGFISPGVSQADTRAWQEDDAKQCPPAPVLVHALSLPISASELRRRAREGRHLTYRMPDSVAHYIRDHGLYRP